MAGIGEFLGGMLVLVGWLNPIGPALIVAVMIVAIATIHIGKGFWNTNGGYEYNLASIAGALAIAGAGEGWYSIDAVAPVRVLAQPAVAAIVFAVIVLGALVTLALRRAPKTAHA
jgi:putative oxidoreductase